MRYDVKCTMCDYIDIINISMNRDLEKEPYGCRNPEYKCGGMYYKIFVTPPTLHNSCIPTRTNNISYSEKTPKDN